MHVLLLKVIPLFAGISMNICGYITLVKRDANNEKDIPVVPKTGNDGFYFQSKA